MIDETPPHGEEFDIWTVMKGVRDLALGSRITDVVWAKRMGGAYVLHGKQNMVSPALTVTHWMRKPKGPEGEYDGNDDKQPELSRTAKNPDARTPDYGETG